MFEVVNTFVVIDISKGKINTIAIDKPIKFVVPNLFFKFLMFLVFNYLYFLLLTKFYFRLQKHLSYGH